MSVLSAPSIGSHVSYANYRHSLVPAESSEDEATDAPTTSSSASSSASQTSSSFLSSEEDSSSVKSTEETGQAADASLLQTLMKDGIDETTANKFASKYNSKSHVLDAIFSVSLQAQPSLEIGTHRSTDSQSSGSVSLDFLDETEPNRGKFGVIGERTLASSSNNTWSTLDKDIDDILEESKNKQMFESNLESLSSVVNNGSTGSFGHSPPISPMSSWGASSTWSALANNDVQSMRGKGPSFGIDLAKPSLADTAQSSNLHKRNCFLEESPMCREMTARAITKQNNDLKLSFMMNEFSKSSFGSDQSNEQNLGYLPDSLFGQNQKELDDLKRQFSYQNFDSSVSSQPKLNRNFDQDRNCTPIGVWSNDQFVGTSQSTNKLPMLKGVFKNPNEIDLCSTDNCLQISSPTQNGFNSINKFLAREVSMKDQPFDVFSNASSNDFMQHDWNKATTSSFGMFSNRIPISD